MATSQTCFSYNSIRHMFMEKQVCGLISSQTQPPAIYRVDSTLYAHRQRLNYTPNDTCSAKLKNKRNGIDTFLFGNLER